MKTGYNRLMWCVWLQVREALDSIGKYHNWSFFNTFGWEILIPNDSYKCTCNVVWCATSLCVLKILTTQSERQGTRLFVMGQLTWFWYLLHIRKLVLFRRGSCRPGGRGPDPHLENQNHRLLYISWNFLKTLVRIPLEKHLDPLRPFASRGRFVRPSVTLIPEKKVVRSPLVEFAVTVHALWSPMLTYPAWRNV